MPLIESLFNADRRIERPIESVITYGRATDAALRSEISEYYVTKHIDEALRLLLDAMQRAQQGGGSEIGIWVAGYYGSGKSSFSKYLGLALDGERKIGDEPFRKLFTARLENPATVALLNGVARNFNPHVLMVDLGSDQLAGKAGQRVSDILYNKVLQSLGYPSERKLAAFQMRLEQDGKLEEFLAKVRAAKNKEWASFMDVTMEAMPLASRLAHQIYPLDFPSDTALSAMKSDVQLTVEEQAREMIDLARRKSGRDNILFILDEAGHFVSVLEDRVLDLKAFAEVIKNVGGGKVWLMATAQQTLMADAQVHNTENLHRLQARFPLPVNLESSDIKEITHLRLLTKSAEGEQALRALWAQHFAQFKLALGLEAAGSFQDELTESAFLQLYPFPPALFEMLVRLLGRLAKKTGGTGLRSAIKVVQEIMKGGDRPMAQREIGTMATAADLYDALRNDIRAGFGFLVQGVEDVGVVFPRQPLHQQVAKAIAILQVHELVPATPQNIAAVLCPKVGVTESMKREVEAVLRDFETNGRLKIQPGQGGSYLFLSDQATSLHRNFEDTQPELSVVNAWLNRSVLKALDEDLPQATIFQHKSIKVALDIWTQDKFANFAGSNEAVHLRVRFASAAQLEDIRREARQESTRDGDIANLTMVAQRQESHGQLANEIAKCERFLGRYSGQQSPEVRDYLQVVTNKKEKAERDLVGQYIQALRSAPVYAHGLALSLDGSVPRLSDAFARLLGQCGEKVYRDYSKAPINVSSRCAEEFLRCELSRMSTPLDPLKLVQGTGTAARLNEAHPAILALRDYLNAHSVPTGKELLKVFEAPPAGWSPDTIRYLVAGLLQGGIVELKINGQPHRVATAEAIQALSSTAGFREVGVKLRQNAPDLATRDRVVTRLEELFGERVLPTEAAIAREVLAKVPDLLPKYGTFGGKLESLGCAAYKRVQEVSAKLQQIVAADGVEIIAELGPVQSRLNDEWTWVRKAEASFTAPAQAYLTSAAQLARFAWPAGEPAFEPLVAKAKELVQLAVGLQQDERADQGFDALRAQPRAFQAFWADAQNVTTQVYQQKLSAYKGRLEALPTWVELDEELRQGLSRQLAAVLPLEGEPDADRVQGWLTAVQRLDQNYVQALSAVESAAATLRAQRQKAIDQGNREKTRQEGAYRLRLPRVLDSAEKMADLRRQLDECERLLAKENLRLDSEIID